MAFRVVKEYYSDIDQGRFKLAVVEVYRVVNGDRESTSSEADDQIISLFPPLPTAYLPNRSSGCTYGRNIRFRELIYTPDPDIVWHVPLPFRSGQQEYVDVLSVVLNNDFPVVFEGERRQGDILRLI